MDVTLRQLKYLTALADHGHFGRAAAAAHVTQPALSQQIQAIEAALGTALVDRGGRRVALTPAGREVARRARDILGAVGTLQDVARAGRGLAGQLRLGVIPTVAPYLLPQALPRLRSRNIGLDLRVREAQTAPLLDALARGELDAIVVALPVPAATVDAAPLFEDRFLLAGSFAQIAGFEGRRVTPEAMEPGRLLLLEDGHCLADQALAACATARDATRVDMRASSLATLCRLVEAGLGLTLLPELAIRAETAAAPGLRLMRFAGREPHRTVGLVRRRAGSGDGWFGELAAILAAAGRDEIAAAGALQPPAAA